MALNPERDPRRRFTSTNSDYSVSYSCSLLKLQSIKSRILIIESIESIEIIESIKSIESIDSTDHIKNQIRLNRLNPESGEENIICLNDYDY